MLFALSVAQLSMPAWQFEVRNITYQVNQAIEQARNNKKHSYSNYKPDILVKSFFRSIHRDTQNPVIFLLSSVCIAPALRGISKKEAASSMLVTFLDITATAQFYPRNSFLMAAGNKTLQPRRAW